MSKKKKPSAKRPKKAARALPPPPLLDEKQTLFKKLRARLKKTSPKIRIPQALKGFASISVFVIPAIFVAAATLTATDMLLHGRIMPRTTFGEANISFAYNDDANDKLRQTMEEYLKTPLTFTVNNTQAQITPEQLGVQFSLQQNSKYLPSYDLRKDTPLAIIGALLFPRKITPLLTFDSEKAQKIVEEKLELKNLRAQNAKINFEKNAPVVAETPGQVLSKNQLIAGIQKSIDTLSPLTVALDLSPEQPAITAQMLESQKAMYATATKTPITLIYEGRKWTFDPAKNPEAITFTQNPSITLKNLQLTLPISLAENQNIQPNDNIQLNQNPNLALDENKIHDFLQNEIITKIERLTSDVKISTDADGKIVIEGKGHNGIKVSPPTLVASLDLALNNNIKKLKVPATETPANVTVSQDLQDRGIKNLIATGHSAFAGSHVGRIKNINVGIQKYNGLLVKQGETFSFNDNLGPVDGQHGFVPELVIKAEGTVPEMGGGLCQVSSTLYRAALFAGFPIVERAAHKYAVSYYAQVLGYGLDATIYPGVHDIRFKNDSPSDIVIQAYTDGDQAYFKFYGTDDGRKVRLDGPYQGNYQSAGATQFIEDPKMAPGTKKQVENNHTGFDSTWYRYIVKDNQENKETLFTRYAAVPAKIKVGASGTDLSTGA